MAGQSVELATGYVSLSITTRGMGRDIAKNFSGIERQAETTGRKAGGRLAAGLGAVLKGGVLAVGASIAAILGASLVKGFGRLQAIDNAKAKLEGLGHSAKEVEKIMNDALASVKGTAFGLDEAASVAAAAIGAGIKPGKELQKTLKLIADAATIGGTSLGEMGAIFNKVAASNKVQGEVIAQLNDRGIPIIQLLAKSMKISAAEVLKLSAAGKIGFKDFQKAMQAGLGGAALKSGDTFQGALKNVGAALARFGANLLKGVFPQMKAVFVDLTKTLDKLGPVAERIGKKLGVAFAGIVAAIGPVAAKIGSLFAAFNSPGAKRASGFLGSFQGASKTLEPVRAGLSGIVAQGQKLGQVVMPIIRQLTAAFIKEWPKIKPVVLETFGTIKGYIVDVMAVIRKIIQIATDTIHAIWSKWGKNITGIVVSLFRLIADVINGALKIIRGIFNVFFGILTGDWKRVGRGIMQIVGGLKTILVGIVKNMMRLIDATIGGYIKAILTKFFNFSLWVGTKFNAAMAKIKEAFLTPLRAARDGVAALMTQLRAKFTAGVSAIGSALDRLQELAKVPIRFVINTVIDGGLLAAFRKISSIVGYEAGKNLHVSAGFSGGGYTGPGPKMKPAGIVHADEYVINAASRRKIERRSPGLLDRLNGYASGGRVVSADGGSSNHTRVNFRGGTFTRLFASRLEAAERLAKTIFHIFQGGFRPPTSYSGTSHKGDAVDLAPIRDGVVRALRQVGIAAWDRTNKGNWMPHIHGVPLPGAGFGAGSAVWQAQDYLRGGDGLGGRDNGPKVGVLAKIGAFVEAGFKSFAGWFKGLIKDPLRKLTSITSTPLGQMVAGVPRTLVEGIVNKVKKFDSGGVLKPGLTLAYNGTGRNEHVRTERQENAFGGLVVNGGVHGLNAAEIAAELDKIRRRREALQPTFAA